MGDLDKDGFSDFAVGAPYEDNGKGVVVLYFGTKEIYNMNRKPSNVQFSKKWNECLFTYSISNINNM